MPFKFETASEAPTGRQSVDVPDEVWDALKSSAEKGEAKAVTLAEREVAQLRKILASSRVRELYNVKTGILKRLENGKVRFGLVAERKTPAGNGAPPPAGK